jgi:hypothetical protein
LRLPDRHEIPPHLRERAKILGYLAALRADAEGLPIPLARSAVFSVLDMLIENIAAGAHDSVTVTVEADDERRLN